uniref:CUB domain-containing protein n=1 Tax=Macrostomum lignano TaxID=282301 RepID=A0A1I8JLG1_9PLAT
RIRCASPPTLWPTAAKPTFTVHFKARNFDKLERQDVINRVFTAVKSVSPDWSVDHDRASVVIDVNVLQRVTCLSLLRNFRRYRKYNLSERDLALLLLNSKTAPNCQLRFLMAGSFSVQQRCLLSLLLCPPRRPRRRSARGWKMRSTGSTGTPCWWTRLQSGGDTEPISIRQASNSENQCDYDYLEANETVASCGDLSFTLAGFTISGDSVPVSPACANPRASIAERPASRKYILDLATGKPTPQCKFSKPQKTTRRGCCPGYGGENCQQVVCFPKDGGCQNGGRCVKPDKCECQSGFQGAMWRRGLGRRTPAFATAFPTPAARKNTKFGRKTTPFSDCCSAGGNSFGYSGVCTACTSSTGNRPFDTCSSFGPNSISTFDGLTYEFEGRCSYLLAGSINPSRRWFVKVAMVNCDTFKSCQKTLRFRLDDLHEFVAVGQSLQVYQISGLDGAQMLKVNDSFQGLFDDARDYSGVRFIRRGDSIIMTSRSLGLRLRWGLHRFRAAHTGSASAQQPRPAVSPEFSPEFYTNSHPNSPNSKLPQGLCGNYDGDKKNEFGEFANPSAFGNAWKAQDCPDSANVPVHCPDTKTTASAEMECRQIDSIFFPCHDRIPPQEFFQRCVQDACLAIRRGEPTSEVVCRHLSAYAGLCSLGGICIDWRSSNLCPTNCSEPNMYWKECASECPTTCANYDQVKSELCQVTTSPRCECEPDYVHHKGKCVRKTDCPCRYNGKEFPAGGTFNTHQCIQGRWSCYKRASCPKTCLVTGSSFRTFDGAQLDFNGRTCEYVLLEPAPNVTDSRLNVTITQRVRTENVLITDPNQLANLPKRVHISYAAYRIELVATSLNYGSRASVFINDEDVTNSLPFSNQDDHLLVKQITSLTTMVKIGSHITVYFDGFRNIEIKANERVRSNVKGLCGNYDGDTENDLHPRNSDMFGSVTELAESYITGVCTDSPIPLRQAAFADQVSGSDHCQLALLTGDSFKACASPTSCRREVASGGVQGQQFLFCSSLVQAAIECKNQGYDVDFYRDSVLSL